MAGERREAVIGAMDLAQLQANKAALTAELRVAATKRKTYEASLGGVLSGASDAIKGVLTVLPEAAWRGKMVDYDATTPAGVLAGAGADTAWPQDARELAAALATTNARIESLAAESKKKEETAAVEAVKASGSTQPTTPAEYYAKLVQVYKDCDVKGRGLPASSDAAEIARANKWTQDQLQFLASIPVDMRLQIIQFGLQGDRWQEDFK